jgi:hypothetical protein
MLGFVSAPAQATLQVLADVNGTVVSCVDNASCDLNPAVGTIQTANQVVNGVLINGSIQTSTGTPANPGRIFSTLPPCRSSIRPMWRRPLIVLVSDTDFTGPVASFSTAGSGVWQNAIGSTITMSWFDDPNNGQGADAPGDTPGNLIDSFSNAATSIVDAFAHDGTGPISDAGPFSMTEEAFFTLMPFAQLINRGQTEIKSAVPEPSTWAMMLLGFAGLGYAGFRKARSIRSIA